MTIYNNPEHYAKETHLPLALAQVRCAAFLPLIEKIEQTKKCPACAQHTLVIEHGNYEEGTTDFVYCENDQLLMIDEDGEEVETDCAFTTDVTDAFEPLQHWYVFDEVLALAYDMDRDGLAVIEKFLGCSWIEYAEKLIEKMEQ